MSKIRKTRIWAEKKKNRKIEKKIFFSGLARNRLKLSKSPKNRFLDQYWSIFSHFRPNFEMAKITNLHQKLSKKRMSKIRKKRIWAEKKKSKNRKNFFFFQDWLEIG